MSILGTVTYAAVSLVTKHGLSSTQPWVTRLGSAISVMVNAWWEGLIAYTVVRPSLALVRFPVGGHSYCLFLRLSLVVILSFVVIPAFLLLAPLHVSSATYRSFFRGGNESRSDPVVHSSSIGVVSLPFARWGVIGSPICSCVIFCGLAATSTACSSNACHRAHVTLVSAVVRFCSIIGVKTLSRSDFVIL
jgi:hypothetical protein